MRYCNALHIFHYIDQTISLTWRSLTKVDPKAGIMAGVCVHEDDLTHVRAFDNR